jgi:hypothetical protein
MATDGVEVVIPWRETPDRLRSFREARRAWQRLGYQPLPVDSGHSHFNLAASRNAGVAMATDLAATVVVIADADTFPQPGPLEAAIAGARTDGTVHLPYTQYRSLGLKGTHQLGQGMPPELCSYTPVAGACSGVFVTTPETWWSIGGMDERFTRWSPEDWAFRLAHETLIGPMTRHPGDVFALHHDDQPSKMQGPEYEACVALYQRYVDAHGDPSAMAALVAGT